MDIISMFKTILLLIILTLLIQCRSDSSKEKSNKLTEFELINGIGPIKEKIELGPVEIQRVERGKKLFMTRCTACHQLDRKLAGPPLRNILDQRTPEYVINIMLNPVEMTLKHPVARKMAQQYGKQMTSQGLNKTQAIDILDFLRKSANGKSN
jgi:cytochrome c2